MSEGPTRLTPTTKARAALRVWRYFLGVRLALRRHPLPLLIERLSQQGHPKPLRIEPVRLGRIVQRVLRVRRLEPRCVFTALVLYRLLREQQEPAQFVLGLPPEPSDQSAHAWVEINGIDVGPPPGRSGHRELARYG